MGLSDQPTAPTDEDRPKKRPRAQQIRNWLGFIRPYADRYAALPRGERMTVIDDLIKQTGSSENTIRRFLAAAQVLETHGIRELPPGVRYLPVASVELIERISKKDPERGRELFKLLLSNGGGIRYFKEMLKEVSATEAPDKSDHRGKDLWLDDALEAIARRAYVDPGELLLAGFDQAPLRRSLSLFAKSAAPVLVVSIPQDRRAAVFDESVLVWSSGPALVTREFLRNIAVAVATFDWVVVRCATLAPDVNGLTADMLARCRERIILLSGLDDR